MKRNPFNYNKNVSGRLQIEINLFQQDRGKKEKIKIIKQILSICQLRYVVKINGSKTIYQKYLTIKWAGK